MLKKLIKKDTKSKSLPVSTSPVETHISDYDNAWNKRALDIARKSLRIPRQL